MKKIVRFVIVAVLIVTMAMTAFASTLRDAMRDSGVYVVPDFGGFYGYEALYTELTGYKEGVAMAEDYKDVKESDFLSYCDALEDIGYELADKDVNITETDYSLMFPMPRTAYYTYWLEMDGNRVKISYSDGGSYGKSMHINLYDGILILNTDGEIKDYSVSPAVSGISSGYSPRTTQPKSTTSNNKTTNKCGMCTNGKRTCSSCDGAGYFIKQKKSIDLGSGASYYTVKEGCNNCHRTGFIQCIYCGGDGVR